MKLLTSQLLFICFISALQLSLRVFRKWDMRYIETRLFSFFCVSSAIWSLGFWGVNIQTNVDYAYYCRCFGMFGVFAFLIIGQAMLLHLSLLPEKVKSWFTYFSLAGIIIFFFLLSPDRVTYQMSSIGLTYSFTKSIWNSLYVLYSFVIAVNMGISIIYTWYHTTYTYVRMLMKKLFFAELIIVFGMLLDTVFPLLNKPAFPGSTIGQFVGLLAMHDAFSFINHSRINIRNMSKYVYTSLASPVLVYDSQLRLQISNDAAISFLGIPISNKNIPLDLLFEIDKHTAFDFEGKRKSLDTVCKRNGIYCNLSINKIINDYNDLTGYIIIVTDLSERMRSFKKLEEATLAATNANQAKTTFLANMSHEIRTPMHAIIGFSELILKMNITPEIRSHVEDIRVSSQNLLAIINDILDISKIESGKVELVMENYHTLNLIDDVSLIISQQAKQKALDFRMKIDPNMPSQLYGDKIHLRSILINLLNNAVKYTKEGFVSFEIDILEQNENQIRLAYKISDSGIGIKKEDLPKIFNSFERLDHISNYSTEGTGLGLSIVSGYVSLMGGQTLVDSEYGKGSTFTVILDQKIVDATIMKQDFAFSRKSFTSTEKEELHFHDVTALIVDDNYVNLKVVRELLHSYGVIVDTASSGKESIDCCKNKHYDLVFMDQMMPEMDGVTAMKQIRLLDSHYAPEGKGKMIVLTADAILGVKERLINQGFDEYLGKPINIEQLEQVLLKFLPETCVVRTASSKELEMHEKQPLDDEVMAAMLANIKRLIREFDFEEIFKLLEQTKQYQLTEEQRALFTSLHDLIEELNIEEAYSLL